MNCPTTPRPSMPPLPPSKRKRPKIVQVPKGMIHIWRVSHFKPTKVGSATWDLFGIFSDEETAYEAADNLWNNLGSYERRSIRVEHKAALHINGKYYLVNVLPFKFKDIPKEDISEDTKDEEFLVDFCRSDIPTDKLFNDYLQDHK